MGFVGSEPSRAAESLPSQERHTPCPVRNGRPGKQAGAVEPVGSAGLFHARHKRQSRSRLPEMETPNMRAATHPGCG